MLLVRYCDAVTCLLLGLLATVVLVFEDDYFDLLLYVERLLSDLTS